MAIPRKGSQLISVNGTVFRQRIRHKPTYCEGNDWSPPHRHHRADRGAGARLMVSLPFARPDNWHGERTIAVCPALVAGYIRRAIEQGGNPGQPGSAITLTVTVTENEQAVLLSETPPHLIPFLWGIIPEDGGIEDLPRCTEVWSRDKQNTCQAPFAP